MFGFLRHQNAEPAYRHVYSRLCQHQRNYYGLRSLPFLSFEAVFLYAVMLESAHPKDVQVAPQICCRLRRLPALASAPDAALGEFCASLSLIMASVKLDDDIRDEGSRRARLLRLLLARQIRKAWRYFAALDPGFPDRLNQLVDTHVRMEGFGSVETLKDYSEPTARAFGEAFALATKLSDFNADRQQIYAVGTQVGEAILLYDCAKDWRDDERTGDFNPVRDEKDRQQCWSQSHQALSTAHRMCVEAFGESSLPAGILAATMEHVSRAGGASYETDDTAEKRGRLSLAEIWKHARLAYTTMAAPTTRGRVFKRALALPAVAALFLVLLMTGRSFAASGSKDFDLGECICVSIGCAIGVALCGGGGQEYKMEKNCWGETVIKPKSGCC